MSENTYDLVNGKVVMTKENTKSSKPKIEKPIWDRSFRSIPEVLTVTEVAEYLRIKEDVVLKLIKENAISTLPGTGSSRIFKGFLLAYLTQNPPKDMGLAGGAAEGPVHLNPGVGF